MPLQLFTTFVEKPGPNWIKRLRDLRAHKLWSCTLANMIAQSAPVVDTGTSIGCTWDDCILTPIEGGRKLDQSSLLVTVESVGNNTKQGNSNVSKQQYPDKKAILRCDEDGCGTAVIRQPFFTNYDLFRYSYCWLSEVLEDRDIQLTHSEWPNGEYNERINKDLESANKHIHDEFLAYFAKQPNHSPATISQKIESGVQSTLISLGYRIKPAPKSWGEGTGLMVIFKDEYIPVTILVECTRMDQQLKVGIHHLRELLFVKHENGEVGVIVTTSRFTKKTRELHANYIPSLALINRKKLSDWLISTANWTTGGDGLIYDLAVAGPDDK